MKTVNITAKDVQLMLEDTKLGEAVASISLNPNVTWLKIVVTDDKPNANGMRIPAEEFANVVNTAVYMPLKMAYGEIAEGHENSLPLGSIAHLTIKDDQVIALAALWNKERPEDIQLLKDRYENGQSIDVSWELNYDVHASKLEDGVLELRNIEMNAVTIVGLPAYMGRTDVVALASKNEGDNKDMDTIDRKDHEKIVGDLNKEIGELKAQLEDATKKLENFSSISEELGTVKAELDKIKPEYEELKSFKEAEDAKREREEKLASIMKKFEEAGIKVNDEYFTDEKKETLLEMEEAALDFFIQEFVAFSSEENEASASLSITSEVPEVSPEASEVEKDDILTHLKSLDEPKK